MKNLNLPTPPSGYIMMAAMRNSNEKIKLEEIFVKYKSIVSFYVKKSLGAFNPDCDDVANEIITNVVEK